MADKQNLSAFMDGDLIDDAFVEALAQDQESQQSWQHYHLIGDVMRGDEPKNLDWNIADSVAAALENEAPHTPVAPVVMPMEAQPSPQKAKRQLPAWLSQLGQVGVAACVSLAVIVGVQQYSMTDANQVETETLPVLQTIPFSGSVEPVSLTRQSVESTTHQEAVSSEQRRRIHAMLQDYELQLRLNSDAQAPLNTETESVVE
ncbi:RseA family anti-sigma factor [Vibrio hippocampi]|uniref:Anti-sigma-E factor RseA n=1 Tax=Vibrio hippocampi TaxID=654686 RepID=A0ABN8DK24_9VIBR|nr:RseA family anti-sigma factor [Vibrio hippocampi]CAH0527153.1 Anti-sigma-E factor RseA [Vibrio hippocampi]